MIIYLLSITLGFILINFILLSFYQLKKQQGLISIWLGFKRKIWMTIGLGVFFLFSYLGVIFSISYFSTAEWNLHIFSIIYHSPTPWIYGGLWVFACLSLCIYLVRMGIKYYFLTRGKDF